ncbi:MAG: universal stress protein [Acidimicrobiales bacterium]|jgi:nucleotide-binding universal stress UspA family protein
MAMFQSVVVGTDGSDTAAEAVRSAIDLAKLCGATLHIVTAYKPRPVRAAGLPDEFRDKVGSGSGPEAVLEEECARARAAGVAVHPHTGTGDPSEAIVRVAEQEKADVIVVGNKGMAGVRRVLGSVPNSVAHQAPCSVLIVQTT